MKTYNTPTCLTCVIPECYYCPFLDAGEVEERSEDEHE